MTQALRKLNFEEYASLDAEDWVELGLPEGRCEYVENEELKELPPESRLNLLIARYLSRCFEQIGIPFELIYTHAFEIEVPVTEQAEEKTRYPDLVILHPDHLELTKNRATITRKMLPPQLIAEVVSSGEENERRDYQAKRKQYQMRGIPEYWLIDPSRAVVLVLTLVGSTYEAAEFLGTDCIQSPTFQALSLTAQQVLSAGEA
ncbi:MAG: Uma2 family endonuclease [Leptolyngbyaceae cyanobacterium CSU_1_3]|nr:Uma2 family endonuclease [Leptolyngbyaceae cyanobacterium CSU_1_3]